MTKAKSSRSKIIAFTLITLLALFSTMCATFAWFITVNPSAKIDTVSGSLDIKFKKLSAIQYVYPYFEGSNSYVDYTKEGSLKKTVLKEEDRSEFPSYSKPESSTLSDGIYLLGDKTFLGKEDCKDFDVASALKLNRNSDSSYTLENVSISKNSVFVLIDKEGNNVLSSLKGDNTFASLTDSNLIHIKEAGFYSLTLKDKVLSIEKKSRSDDAILEMTTLDPTYAKLNGQNEEEAVYSQNTLMIFDIALEVINQSHPFRLNCEVRRKSPDEEKMTSLLSPYLCYKAEIAKEESDIETIYKKYHSEQKEGFTSFETNEDVSLSILNKNLTAEDTSLNLYLAIDYDPEKIIPFFQEQYLGQAFELQRDFTFYFYVSQVIDGGN